MFGLSTKEILSNAILNTAKNKIDIYKQGIKTNIDVLNGNAEDRMVEILISSRREYLDEVVNSVINTFDVSSPIIASKIRILLMSPSLCGYEDINIYDGIMAGSLYAICYYAINNKFAKPRDCIKLNHLQNDIMNMALTELESEIWKTIMNGVLFIIVVFISFIIGIFSFSQIIGSLRNQQKNFISTILIWFTYHYVRIFSIARLIFIDYVYAIYIGIVIVISFVIIILQKKVE